MTGVLATLSGVLALVSLVAMLATRRMAAGMDHRATKATADAAFVQWARWTFLSVSDREGRLFYRSLYDLRREPEDLIWDLPHACILFHAGPDDPDPSGYRKADDG